MYQSIIMLIKALRVLSIENQRKDFRILSENGIKYTYYQAYINTIFFFKKTVFECFLV